MELQEIMSRHVRERSSREAEGQAIPATPMGRVRKQSDKSGNTAAMSHPVLSSDVIPIDRVGTPPFVTQVPAMGRRTTTKTATPKRVMSSGKTIVSEHLLLKERMTML
jgi:hypothetical protein